MQRNKKQFLAHPNKNKSFLFRPRTKYYSYQPINRHRDGDIGDVDCNRGNPHSIITAAMNHFGRWLTVFIVFAE
jgi:hypothetical protein